MTHPTEKQTWETEFEKIMPEVSYEFCQGHLEEAKDFIRKERAIAYEEGVKRGLEMLKKMANDHCHKNHVGDYQGIYPTVTHHHLACAMQDYIKNLTPHTEEK